MYTLDALSRIIEAQSVQDVMTCLSDITDAAGYSWWTYADITRVPASDAEPTPYCITTVPKAFASDYQALGGAAVDSTVPPALSIGRALQWSELADYHEAIHPRRGPTRKGVKLMQAAFDHNIWAGKIYPVKTFDANDQPVYTIVAMLKQRDNFGESTPPELERWLHTIVHAANTRLSELANFTPASTAVNVTLTSRESDVLRWAARGKTLVDTGDILGISAHTVDKHLQNAMNKIGAANKTHAVALALSKGYIAL